MARDPSEGNAFVHHDDEAAPRTKKDIQVFDGVGAVKKRERTGFSKWLCEVFFSGRSLKEILWDIFNEQLVPEGRDMLRNGLVSLIDARFYKDSKPGSYTVQGSSGNFITRYIDYSKMAGKAPTKNAATEAALAANKEKDKETIQAGYELPSFPNAKSAEDFLNSMKAEADKYEQLSVYDMAWKRGQKVDYGWEEYGWNKDEILAIRAPSRFRQPIVVDFKGQKVKMTHYIDMPPSHPLS